jgi:hypothetical protein
MSNKNKFNMEVEVLKLKDAIVVASNTNATEQEVAGALITVNKFFKELSKHKYTLSNKLQEINNSKQMELELVYSNTNGDSLSVLSGTIEHTSVDMVGVHKDAQANISVTYSDKIYEQVFKPNVRASKKDIIKLAEEGLLPNASQRVKKISYQQTKLFDFVEPNKE